MTDCAKQRRGIGQHGFDAEGDDQDQDAVGRIEHGWQHARTGRDREEGGGGLRIHGGRIDLAASLYPSAPQPWIDLSTGIPLAQLHTRTGLAASRRPAPGPGRCGGRVRSASWPSAAHSTANPSWVRPEAQGPVDRTPRRLRRRTPAGVSRAGWHCHEFGHHTHRAIPVARSANPRRGRRIGEGGRVPVVASALRPRGAWAERGCGASDRRCVVRRSSEPSPVP